MFRVCLSRVSRASRTIVYDKLRTYYTRPCTIISSRLGGRPHSFVVVGRSSSVNNARRPTRRTANGGGGGGDDTDDGYNDDNDDDDDYYNCSLLLQNKPKMRSCRRWSQADSLALDTTALPPPPAIDHGQPCPVASAFKIGGPVSAPIGDIGRSRFGGGDPASLQPYRDTPPPLAVAESPQPPPLPPRRQDAAAAAAVQDACARRTPQSTVADLPVIPESSPWDDDHRGRDRRTTVLPLERNSSTRVRNAYRPSFNRTAASPTAVVSTAVHCRDDNQVRNGEQSGGGGGGNVAQLVTKLANVFGLKIPNRSTSELWSNRNRRR